MASTRALLSYLDAQASLPDSERPLVVFVISGGASALLELPRAGVTLTELQAANEAMLKAGRDIQALNTLRGGFSEVKGGRLWARYEGRLHFVTLVLSDVIGDDPAVVGSGPTCGWPPDWDAVERAVAGVPMPSTLSAIIRARPKSQFWQMPQRCHVRHVVASNAVALDAAAQAAEARGLKVMRWGEPLRGEARDVGRAIAQALLELDGSECLLAGGETTVTVRGDGRGGRAQELALAAACVLEGSDCVLLSAGSDGIDGRSESAGACVDGGSVARARAAGASPEAHLVRNDSASFHEASGDSWITGPTGTNVMDLVVALRPSRE